MVVKHGLFHLRRNAEVRVFESTTLKQIFWPKKDESGKRRNFREEFHSLYRSPNIVRVVKSRRLRWAEHVVKMGEGRSAFKMLTGKPLGEPRHRWEDKIRMHLK